MGQIAWTADKPVRPRGDAGLSQSERNDLVAHAYTDYHAELINYLRRKYGEGPPAPQDVAHQAFLSLSQSGKLGEIRNIRAFLYRTAINIVIDHQRSESRRDGLLRRHLGPSPSENCDFLDPERVLRGKEELKRIEKAVMSLPERERIIFLLNRVEGVSISEIANRTGLSVSGVRLIVMRCLRKCRRAAENGDRRD